jgi:polysaccharide pyruvyl transferase WcaK-like protein
MPDPVETDPPLDLSGGFKLVVLNVSGLLYNGGFTLDNMFRLRFSYKSFVRELIIKILEHNDCHILLVPHTVGSADRWEVESDPYACNQIRRELPPQYRDRVHLQKRTHDQYETKAMIGLCNFFIGSRMHACIAALSQGIPTVGIAYSSKFKGVFDSMGVGEKAIDARSADFETAMRETCLAFGSRDNLKGPLKEQVDAAKSELYHTFEGLLNRMLNDSSSNKTDHQF